MRIVRMNFHIVIMFIGPFIEELLKGIFLVVLLSRLRYRSISMGIVYGSLIGLGFAYIENIVFILSGAALEIRLLSGMLHIVETGFAGGLLAYGLIYKPGKIGRFVLFAVIICSLLHISVNATSYSNSFNPLFAANILLQLMSFVSVVTIVLSAENRIIEQELKMELKGNIIPEKEYQTFLHKINKFPYFRNNNQIILCATRLAMMSHYQKNSSLDFYEREKLINRINLYRKSYGVSA